MHKFVRYLITMLLAFCLIWPSAAFVHYIVLVGKCNPGLLSRDSYIAACNDLEFGDFEHEAFYYGLNQTAERIRTADILLIGDSHLQYAFSRPNVEAFFQSHHAKYMLMGFGYAENSEFAQDVLRRHPHNPKIAIINIDPFIGPTVTQPGRFVLDHPIKSFFDAVFKSAVQPIYRRMCRRAPPAIQPFVCGGAPSIMRSEVAGRWFWVNSDVESYAGSYPVTPSAARPQGLMTAWLAQVGPAVDVFFNIIGARCIVLTDTPHDGPVGDFAELLARSTGAYFIDPDLPGLRTVDTAHLDAASAIRWSNAFLAKLEPLGHSCGAW